MIRYSLLFGLIFGVACSPDHIDSNTRLSDQEGNTQNFITVSDLTKEDAFFSEGPELIFTADQEEILTQELLPNEALIVRYNFKRLSKCQPTGRNYLRHLTGFYQVDYQEPKSFDYIPAYTTSEYLQNAQIIVPEGKELSVWFFMVDSNGCSEWDSNDGNNYIVPIKQIDDLVTDEEATILFKSDGDIIQSGSLKSDSNLTIEYELNRLNICEITTDQPQWGITGHMQTDLSDIERFPMTEIRDGEFIPLSVKVNIPEGSVLKVWFTATNRYGCFEEDEGGSFDIN